MCSNRIIPNFIFYKNIQVIIMIHFFLLFSLVAFGLFIFFARNPIHAVLFLILAIINSSFILFYLNVEFLGLVLIIIYVGAVAILFLFIVMMLKIKMNFLVSYKLFPIYFFVACFIASQFFLLFQDIYTSYDFVSLNKSLISFDLFQNLDVIGQALFSGFLIPFLLAGLVLLVAMLIAIVLTLKFSNPKTSEAVYAQLSRASSGFLTFFS